jgi:hypothetical protein
VQSSALSFAGRDCWDDYHQVPHVWPEFQTRQRRDVLQMLPARWLALSRVSRAPATSPDSAHPLERVLDGFARFCSIILCVMSG